MSQTFTTVSSGTPFARAPRKKRSPHIGKLQVAVLLGQDLAQAIRILDREPCKVDGHPGDVLLVDHHAVRLRQRLRDTGMEGPVGSAVETFHECLDVLVGGRTDDGAGDHEVFVVPSLHLREELPGGGGLHVEYTQCFPAGDQVSRVGIREWIEALPLQAHTVIALHERQRVAQHGKRPVSQQIDLHQAAPPRRPSPRR